MKNKKKIKGARENVKRIMVLDLGQAKCKSLNIALTCHICKNCDDLFLLLLSKNSTAAMEMINNKNNFCSTANTNRQVCV